MRGRGHILGVNWSHPLNKGLSHWWTYRGARAGQPVIRDECGIHDLQVNYVGSTTWEARSHFKEWQSIYYINAEAEKDVTAFEQGFPCSFASWARADAAREYSSFFAGMGDDHDEYFSIVVDDANDRFYYQLRRQAAPHYVSWSATPDPTRFYHIVGVSYAANDHRLFVDGIQRATSTTSFGDITINRLAHGRLRDLSAPTNVHGSTSDVRVYWNRGLSSSEVWDLYQESKAGYPHAFRRRVFRGSATAAASAAITGTATASINEDDVVTGSKTIIITLTGDTWVAAGASFNAVRQDIIDGLDSAQVESFGWNAEVRDKEVVGAVVRTSDTVVTITLTAAASYDITAQETITVTVPASALVGSGSPITGSPTFTVDTVASGIPYLLEGGMFAGGFQTLGGGL